MTDLTRAPEPSAEDIEGYWRRFKAWMRTQTRDTSVYGLHYLSGLLRMGR